MHEQWTGKTRWIHVKLKKMNLVINKHDNFTICRYSMSLKVVTKSNTKYNLTSWPSQTTAFDWSAAGKHHWHWDCVCMCGLDMKFSFQGSRYENLDCFSSKCHIWSKPTIRHKSYYLTGNALLFILILIGFVFANSKKKNKIKYLECLETACIVQLNDGKFSLWYSYENNQT